MAVPPSPKFHAYETIMVVPGVVEVLVNVVALPWQTVSVVKLAVGDALMTIGGTDI